MRAASVGALEPFRDQIRAWNRAGGVPASTTGNIARSKFDFQGDEWRWDLENEAGNNLRVY